MTLRTPRRRIAPRTIRRYRAIKQFFRKALGSISQPDINSSRTDHVIHLKHKIIGLEQQLSEVSKHCRDIIGLESSSRRESESNFPNEARSADELSANQLRDVEVIYKTSDGSYVHSEVNDLLPNINNETNVIHKSNKVKKKKSKENTRLKDLDMAIRNRRSDHKSIYPNIGSYSASSLVSDDRIDKERRRKKAKSLQKPRYDDIEEIEHETTHRTNLENFERYYKQLPKRHRTRKPKTVGNIDQDYIADIIKRQYRPVKLFGRRESNISQVSEPVCRDHEYTVNHQAVQEDSDLCSCRCGGKHRVPLARDFHNEQSDARSICDTRLYSCKKYPRMRHHVMRKATYDDTELYDLVPVKETTSPKSRRKFVQDNMHYNYYKEVPPSPKTHRPRLNLKAQYYSETEDISDFNRHPRKMSPKSYKRLNFIPDGFDSDTPSEIPHEVPKLRPPAAFKTQLVHEEVGTSSGSQYPDDPIHHPIDADSSINKSHDTCLTLDKTDKALCEIKDILQTFLQEIKKEASCHSGKSDVSTKTTDNTFVTSPKPPQMNPSNPLTQTSFSYTLPPCPVPPAPYIPPYSNPCCYPMLPVYPMMQNGCVLPPSQSHTCPCASKQPETTQTNSGTAQKNTTNDTLISETDELIKEIYKFVAQSPTFSRKQDEQIGQESAEHKLTSRSVGGSTQFRRHDANVGTPDLKCYSKSCDAIGSRLVSGSYCTGASFSESLLENISLEATGTTSDTDISTSYATRENEQQLRKNKLKNMLRSFSLFKKKRKDVIEELSESDSIPDHHDNAIPYGQNVVNYSMYGQDYYQSPHISHRPPDSSPVEQECNPPYNPGMHPHMSPRLGDHHYQRPSLAAPSSSHYYPQHQPTAPPFIPPFDQYSQAPQNPLCLKEIEVKSTGTQSEKKSSFFNKFKKSIHASTPHSANESFVNNNIATQTPHTPQSPQTKHKMFNWKSLNPKSMVHPDPLAYSYETQKKLAIGDEKLRNTLLQKMLYRKNPFSPSHFLAKSLFGQNKSPNFINPMTINRRMF